MPSAGSLQIRLETGDPGYGMRKLEVSELTMACQQPEFFNAIYIYHGIQCEECREEQAYK